MKGCQQRTDSTRDGHDRRQRQNNP